MNREQTKEAIAVMQAYVDGEEIQYSHAGSKWACVPNAGVNWNWDMYAYRINPTPREFWIMVDTLERGNHVAFASKPENKIPGHKYIHVREVLEGEQ